MRAASDVLDEIREGLQGHEMQMLPNSIRHVAADLTGVVDTPSMPGVAQLGVDYRFRIVVIDMEELRTNPVGVHYLGFGVNPIRYTLKHGIRRAIYDFAFGYVSGFPVRDILPWVWRFSLSPKRASRTRNKRDRMQREVGAA